MGYVSRLALAGAAILLASVPAQAQPSFDAPLGQSEVAQRISVHYGVGTSTEEEIDLTRRSDGRYDVSLIPGAEAVTNPIPRMTLPLDRSRALDRAFAAASGSFDRETSAAFPHVVSPDFLDDRYLNDKTITVQTGAGTQTIRGEGGARGDARLGGLIRQVFSDAQAVQRASTLDSNKKIQATVHVQADGSVALEWHTGGLFGFGGTTHRDTVANEPFAALLHQLDGHRVTVRGDHAQFGSPRLTIASLEASPPSGGAKPVEITGVRAGRFMVDAGAEDPATPSFRRHSLLPESDEVLVDGVQIHPGFGTLRFVVRDDAGGPERRAKSFVNFQVGSDGRVQVQYGGLADVPSKCDGRTVEGHATKAELEELQRVVASIPVDERAVDELTLEEKPGSKVYLDLESGWNGGGSVILDGVANPDPATRELATLLGKIGKRVDAEASKTVAPCDPSLTRGLVQTLGK